MEFEQRCNRTITSLPNGTQSLQEYDDCNNTIFEDMTIEFFNLSNWRITRTTFSNIAFYEVNFTNVTFRDCRFRNCSIQDARFDSTSFLNSTWEGVHLESVSLTSSEICGLVAQNVTVQEFIIISDVDINGQDDLNTTNPTLFLQLVESGENATCEKSVDPCEAVQDNRVYRDNFFVAASALPGNLASAVAVYFLRRNYWLGECVCVCVWGGGCGCG